MTEQNPKVLECQFRKATPEDVEKAFPFCKQFFAETAAKLGQGFDDMSCKELMLFLVIYEIAYVAVIGDEIIGCIAGTVDSNTMNKNEAAFKEVFWYVNPDYRKSRIGRRLYDILIKELKSRGIQFCIMANRSGDEKLSRFYFYHDYKPMETLWIKKIT